MGANFAQQVGFTAAPKTKNGEYGIFNVSFSAVPNINNGNNLIFKTGLSAVPVRKNGTKFSKKVGFAGKPDFFSFFSDKSLKIHIFVQFDNFMSRTFSSGSINLGGRGHRFILTLESRFPSFKDLKIRLCLPQRSTKFIIF